MRLVCTFVATLFLTGQVALACPFKTNPDQALRLDGQALHRAVESCAQKGFDFSAELRDGRVPFREIVAVNTAPNEVELMLKAGADPNTTNKRGSPAFVDAINFAYDRESRDFLRMIDILGQYGADFSRPDDQGDLSLSKAAGGGDNELLTILLKYGADPNGLNTYDRTPLFETVFGTCNSEGGALLIEAGATLSPMPTDQVSRLFDEAQKTCSDTSEGKSYIERLKAMTP